MDLFGFQREDVDKLKKQRSRLIGSEPGTGKTYQGLALDLENRSGDNNGTILRLPKTLIVCPKSVISVWDDHCMKLTDLDVMVIDPKNRQAFIKDALNPRQGGYFICHWEALRLMPELQKVRWFHIIADECHRAKNRKAQQTRALKKLQTVYKTGMSGTPADNKPQDLWSIVNWLWPKYYTSFWRFVRAYTISEKTEEGYTKFVGLREEALPHLRKEMGPWYVRRLKKDVLTELPDKYYTRIWVDLAPKQRRAYDQMRKTMIAWVDSHKEELERNDPIIAQATVSQLVRLQQFACGYVIPRLDPDTGEHVYKWGFPKDMPKELRDKIRNDPNNPEYEEYRKYQYDVTDPSSKLDTLMDIIEDRDEQIVVFSQYRGVIDLLAPRLEAKQIPFGLLTGSTKQDDRGRLVQDFQDRKIRVFAGTIAAGGVGITLTAASTVVFIDRSWSPAINSQAEDRLHRIGQKDAVEVIDLMAKNTVDLGKAQQLATKWKWLQMILGDTVNTDMVITDLGEPDSEQD